MPPIYVSIDLETTGLDPERDAIIEIGIVRFQGGEILDQWSSLFNPRRRVPPNITELTGITQADVDGAPTLFQLRSKVGQVVGSSALVAHNASFDLAFLHRNGLCESNSALDTLELATILLPSAGRFGLGALAQHLGIPTPPGMRTHRALADALITAGLFRSLVEKAEALPYETLEEIVAAGRSVHWPALALFEDALGAVSRRAFSGPGQTSPGHRRP